MRKRNAADSSGRMCEKIAAVEEWMHGKVVRK
jgi:hypothetical protein